MWGSWCIRVFCPYLLSLCPCVCLSVDGEGRGLRKKVQERNAVSRLKLQQQVIDGLLK